MKKVKQYRYIIIFALLFLGFGIYIFQSRPQKQKTVDPNKIADAIKYLEAEYPPRIGKNPTNEAIYSSPYIKRIRLALDEYLIGSKVGIEEEAFSSDLSTDDLKCGLDTFDKSYYKSKFVILSASDSDYGGVQASIIFIDKPDKIFWVWIYNDSAIRTFCEDMSHSHLIEAVKTDIKNGMYPVSF